MRSEFVYFIWIDFAIVAKWHGVDIFHYGRSLALFALTASQPYRLADIGFASGMVVKKIAPVKVVLEPWFGCVLNYYTCPFVLHCQSHASR